VSTVALSACPARSQSVAVSIALRASDRRHYALQTQQRNTEGWEGEDLRAESIAATNVFSANVGGRLADTDVEIVQALADVAAIGLLRERAIRRGELLTEQLQRARQSHRH